MPKHYTYEIEPLARFTNLNAAIRRPREFTCFSYDDDHQFRLDDSSLRYYFPPILPADLNQGFDTFRQLDDSADEHLDGLLKALAAFESQRGSALETDIVTWRGMMTKIMIAPFSPLDNWEMNATCFQGTIFIEENHEKKLRSKTEQHSQAPRPGAKSQDQMSYWGYKFESLCLLSAPWQQVSRGEIEGREEALVSNHAQYCSIVRTGFGKTKMIIAGEVDAVSGFKPEDKTEAINWVELKTSASIHSDRDLIGFERKLLKFWAQSFLLGVPKIIVGFRTRDGTLERLEEMETQQIPEKVLQNGKRLWDGQICINFASTFLEFLRNTITEGGVWRIRKLEKRPVIEVFQIEETGHGSILSDEFVQSRMVLGTTKSAEVSTTTDLPIEDA